MGRTHEGIATNAHGSIETIFFLQRSAFLSPSIGILVLKVGSVFVSIIAKGNKRRIDR